MEAINRKKRKAFKPTVDVVPSHSDNIAKFPGEASLYAADTVVTASVEGTEATSSIYQKLRSVGIEDIAALTRLMNAQPAVAAKYGEFDVTEQRVQAVLERKPQKNDLYVSVLKHRVFQLINRQRKEKGLNEYSLTDFYGEVSRTDLTREQEIKVIVRNNLLRVLDSDRNGHIQTDEQLAQACEYSISEFNGWLCQPHSYYDQQKFTKGYQAPNQKAQGITATLGCRIQDLLPFELWQEAFDSNAQKRRANRSKQRRSKCRQIEIPFDPKLLCNLAEIHKLGFRFSFETLQKLILSENQYFGDLLLSDEGQLVRDGKRIGKEFSEFELKRLTGIIKENEGGFRRSINAYAKAKLDSIKEWAAIYNDPYKSDDVKFIYVPQSIPRIKIVRPTARKSVGVSAAAKTDSAARMSEKKAIRLKFEALAIEVAQVFQNLSPSERVVLRKNQSPEAATLEFRMGKKILQRTVENFVAAKDSAVTPEVVISALQIMECGAVQISPQSDQTSVEKKRAKLLKKVANALQNTP